MRYTRYIPIVVLVASLAGLAWIAPSAGAPLPHMECDTKAFTEFSHKVWAKDRWHRGDPPQSTIRAQREKLDCVGSKAQAVMQRTWKRDQNRFYSKRQRCRSGTVIKGRVSYFGGGLMASGHYTHEPAIALNISPGSDSGWNNSTTRGWVNSLQKFWVTVMGKTEVLFVGDLGPAGFTNRAIDVTEGGVAKLGVSASAITDTIGTAKLVPHGCL